MIQLKIISVRSMSADTIDHFFNSDAGIAEYIQKHFQDTGRLVSRTTRISEDFSTQTKTLVFKSQEDYDDFINDEVLQYQEILHNRYNKFHNITTQQLISDHQA